MTAAQGAIMFIILVLGGELLELLLTRLYYWIKRKPYKKYHFSFARYIMFLLFPLLGFLLIIFLYSYQPLKVFLIFAIAGTVLEWAVGFAYNMIVGQKLWTYHRYSITGYTSLLATPVWGLLGILEQQYDIPAESPISSLAHYFCFYSDHSHMGNELQISFAIQKNIFAHHSFITSVGDYF